MAFEIERKFLVRNQEWRRLARVEARLRQAYLAAGDKSSTRVRIKDEVAATVTIKAKGTGLRRLEVEYPICLIDGEALMSLRQSSLIEKVRHQVPWHHHTWEIDVFSGDNAGLILAEIELRALARRRSDGSGALLQQFTGATPLRDLAGDDSSRSRRLTRARRAGPARPAGRAANPIPGIASALGARALHARRGMPHRSRGTSDRRAKTRDVGRRRRGIPGRARP